jgi:hypothetical protein
VPVEDLSDLCDSDDEPRRKTNQSIVTKKNSVQVYQVTEPQQTRSSVKSQLSLLLNEKSLVRSDMK